jgi:hypothetical protein
MRKSLIISSVLAVGLVVTLMAGSASARDVSASSGQARIGSQANCFNFDFNNGSATSTCFADFIVPLTTDTAGAKGIFFTSRATAVGGVCRAVTNNLVGTAFAATPFLAVPVNANFVDQFLGSLTVPGLGVLFIDCITNPGTSVLHFDYLQ